LEQTPSFRGDAKHRTRNLEIPGLTLTRHPAMTASRLARNHGSTTELSHSIFVTFFSKMNHRVKPGDDDLMGSSISAAVSAPPN
jgi:hypothetical protein